MRQPQQSPSIRTEDFARAELPLPAPVVPPPAPLPVRRPADRIKEALLRWLEEEL